MRNPGKTAQWMAGFFAAVVFAVAAWTGGLCAQDASPATIQERPGTITFRGGGPLSVSARRGEKTIRWSVSSPGAISPVGNIVHAKKATGGFIVELPLQAGPSLTWDGEGLVFHWTVEGKTDGTGLFNTYRSPAYPLGPGDRLKITVYNVKDMNQSVLVDPDGFITFPVLDKVKVLGLTLNHLQTRLEELLGQYVKSPQVSVQIEEYASRYVNVLGEVGSPGRIPLKEALRVLDAVSQAGGFTTNSGDVEIRRRDAAGNLHTMTLTQEDLLTSGATRANIFLLDQDVVNVHGVKSIFVSGEVKSPGSFPYNEDMTLLRAITLAGGFGQWAKKDKVDILRQREGAPRVIHVNVTRIEKGKDEDVPLEPNDHVVVRERKFF